MFAKPKFWVVIAALAAGAFLAQQFWKWEVERVEVPPGKFLVVIHRWGKDLPPDEILAPDESYKGVMRETRPTGRHFLNPVFWSYEIHDLVNVPAGQCLVLTRKFGKLPSGGQVVAGDEERGIVGDPLRQGSYAINPYAFDKELVPVRKIEAGYVGVRTLKVGKDPRELKPGDRPSPYVVPAGYRGVQADPARPAEYYVNPYVETINPVEVRSHKVEFKDIQFPSKDGFFLNPHVQVEYSVMERLAPELIVRVTDFGELYQKDDTPQDIEKNEILQKLVLPQVRGYARIEGSNFNAADFINIGDPKAKDKAANSRQLFQRALLASVRKRCAAVGVEIRAITVADMKLPQELLDEISAREQAVQEQQRNLELVKQFKQEQSVKAEEARKGQKTQVVQAQTRLLQTQTQAEQDLKVEKQKLEAAVTVAESDLAAAKATAGSVRDKGKAKADVVMADNKAEVAALRKSVEGFGGAQYFAQYKVLERLAPALSEIFTSDTSDFGKLFSGLMMPENGGAKPAPSAARTDAPMPPIK